MDDKAVDAAGGQIELVEEQWLRDVYRGNRMPELTLRCVAAGALLAGLMITLNVYMGLKTGWQEGGAIVSVILAFSMMRALEAIGLIRAPYSPLENNLSQTMASAAGSLGNIVTVIPALLLLVSSGVIAKPPAGLDIVLWCFFTSALGVVWAIPLRRQLIVVEQLRFPTGTAAAATIEAMHSGDASSKGLARSLGAAGLASFLLTWLRDWNPAGLFGTGALGFLRLPHNLILPGSLFGCSASSLGLGVAVSPLMLGIGMLSGPRVGLSLLFGALTGWALIAPWLFNSGVLHEISSMLSSGPAPSQVTYALAVKWLMWPALGCMVAAGLTATLLRYRLLAAAFRSMLRAGRQAQLTALEIPLWSWLVLLVVTTVSIAIFMDLRFGIPVWVAAGAALLSCVLSSIAARATGETDMNPVGTMGSITQIVFSAVYPGSVTSNLLTAGISASASAEAGDMMQDLKAGQLLGSTPRRLVLVQFLGVAVGSLLAAPVLAALVQAYGLGSPELPAPSAITWSGLAQMLAKGSRVLPSHALAGLGAGVLLGAALTVLDVRKVVRSNFLPSPVGIGVGLIIPANYSVAIFLGAMLVLLVARLRARAGSRLAEAVGAGAIAGEGVAAVIVAVLVVTGVM